MPKGEKIYGTITISVLHRLASLSKKVIRQDISKGDLNPGSLNDIFRWLNKPRSRKNKGKPLTWLNKLGVVMEDNVQTQELNTQKGNMHLVDVGDALVSFARKIAEEQITSANLPPTTKQPIPTQSTD